MTSLVKKRLEKLKKMAVFLQLVPFLRAVILNGSLAEGRAKASSDIDILIIAQAGRLYTVRFVVLLLASLSGQKRSKDAARPHSGKFCFNYFLTSGYLKIPAGRGETIDRYCAQNYSKCILVWGNQKLYDKLIRVNKALFERYNCRSDNRIFDKYLPVKNNKLFNFLRDIKEKMLAGTFGNWLERKLKMIQIKRIEQDTRTFRYPLLIVYSDREARFHPPKN